MWINIVDPEEWCALDRERQAQTLRLYRDMNFKFWARILQMARRVSLPLFLYALWRWLGWRTVYLLVWPGLSRDTQRGIVLSEHHEGQVLTARLAQAIARSQA